MTSHSVEDTNPSIDQELLMGIFVQMSRILDILYVVLDKLDGDAVAMREYHSDGKILSPEAWLDVD